MTYFVTWHDVYEVIVLSNVNLSLITLGKNRFWLLFSGHALHAHNNHSASSSGRGVPVGKARIISLMPRIKEEREYFN